MISVWQDFALGNGFCGRTSTWNKRRPTVMLHHDSPVPLHLCATTHLQAGKYKLVTWLQGQCLCHSQAASQQRSLWQLPACTLSSCLPPLQQTRGPQPCLSLWVSVHVPCGVPWGSHVQGVLPSQQQLRGSALVAWSGKHHRPEAAESARRR